MDNGNAFTNYANVTIKFSGFVQHGPVWIEKKTRSHYGLWFVTQGSVLLETRGDTYTLEAKQVLFMKPGFSYTARALDGRCSFFYVQMDFQAEYEESLLENHLPVGIYEVEAPEDAAVYTKKLGGSPLAVKGAVTLLLADMDDMCRENAPGVRRISSEESGRKRRSTRYDRVIYRICEQAAEGIFLSVEEMAKTAGLHPKYFSLAFKQSVGMPPGQYILKVKMNQAVRLLQENMPIKEIAELCGYENQQSFTKAFKKYFGDPPAQVKSML